MNKTPKKKREIKIGKEGKEKRKVPLGPLKAREIIEIFGTGLCTPQNPGGLIQIDDFHRDKFSNVKTKLFPIGCRSTKFTFGTLEKPIYLTFMENLKFTHKDQNKKNHFSNLDKEEGKGHINAVFKIYGNPPTASQYYNAEKYEIIQAARKIEDCQKEALLENIKKKIVTIKDIYEAYKKEKKREPNDRELTKALGDQWFFDDDSIPTLKDKYKKISKASSGGAIKNIYRPLIKKNPQMEDAAPFIKLTALLKHKEYSTCEIHRVLNPDCKEDNNLDTELIILDEAKDIEKLFGKTFKGYVTGSLGNFTSNKGWGLTFKIYKIFIIEFGKDETTIGNRTIKVKKKTGVNSLFESFGVEEDNGKEKKPKVGTVDSLMKNNST